MATPQKKKPRDYNKALDSLSQLENHLVNDKSPLVAELKAYMAPYEAAVKAGQITEKDYMRIGGKFSQDWVNKNLFGGEGIPNDDEMKGPMLQAELARRAQTAAADPRHAEMLKQQPSLAAAGGGDADSPYGPLGRQAGALAALAALAPPEEEPQPQPAAPVPPQPRVAPMPMPAQPDSPKLARALKSGAEGVMVPAVGPDGSDEEKLGESQLLLLRQLAHPSGYDFREQSR
jgi:hypothetical protein